MNTGLGAVFSGVAYVFAQAAAAPDPNLSKLFESVTDKLSSASDAFRNNETELQSLADQLHPVLAKVNWFAVACLSSLIAFSLAGFLYARISGQRQWATALPLMAVLSGQSPCMLLLWLTQHGVAAASVNFLEQAALVAIQIVSVVCWAQLGWLMHQRRRPGPLKGS